MSNKINFESLPEMVPVSSGSIERELLRTLQNMEDCAEACKKAPIDDQLLNQYRHFQGLYHYLQEQVCDTGLVTSVRENNRQLLSQLPLFNPLAYLDDCRRQVKSLKKQFDSYGKVLTETRDREVREVLRLINENNTHVLLTGLTGLGKTVLAKLAAQKYLESSNKDKYYIRNAAETSFEELFGSTQIIADEKGTPKTYFKPGCIYDAVREGVPFILEEYNSNEDGRYLNALKTLLSTEYGEEITLANGEVVTVKDGFTFILTGNPSSSNYESFVQLLNSDAAILSRVVTQEISQLKPEELLLQFLICNKLLDGNMGARLPRGLYDKLKVLMQVSSKLYSQNPLTDEQFDNASLRNPLSGNFLSQRNLTRIFDALKRNDYIDPIDDVILKVYIAGSLAEDKTHDDAKLIYTVLQLNGFFNDGKYPHFCDPSLITKLKGLVKEIDLAPVEFRTNTQSNIDVASFLNLYNTALNNTVTGEFEYIPFTKIFKDCFGDMPNEQLTLELFSRVEIDDDKIRYIKDLFDNISQKVEELDINFKVLSDLLSRYKVPSSESSAIDLISLVLRYADQENDLSSDELNKLSELLNGIDIRMTSNEFEPSDDDLIHGQNNSLEQISSQLSNLFILSDN